MTVGSITPLCWNPHRLRLLVLGLLLSVLAAGSLFCETAGAPGAAFVEARERVPSREVIDRVHDLRREIARHDDLYFRLNAPEISDLEYDRLKAELLRLEEEYPNYDYGSSPVAPVGDDRTGLFSRHRHHTPMLSLDKAMSEQDLLVFHQRMTREFGGDGIDYWVEPKMDGIGISLTYESGRLVRALTRGNGEEGEDVTAHVLTIEGVPAELAGDSIPALVEVRGEIYLPWAEFARINEEQTAAGEEVFANPRNLAAGTVKLTDARQAAQRRLEFAAFGWGAFEPTEERPATLAEFRERLADWGLPVVREASPATGWKEMLEAVNRLERSREDLPFPVDGAVVKLALTEGRDRLGSSRSAPRWAIAKKFAPERASTRLLEITLQIGRTGAVTPVAELEPVWLDGSTVARASLHNADEIARRDLRIGDMVYVEKAGDIIPVIVGVDLSQRSAGSEPYRFPERCPSCEETLSRADGEVVTRCLNDGCSARILRMLEHFVSPPAMNIRGLGPVTLAALVEQAGVRAPADLYSLRKEDLLSVKGIGERSAGNLLAAIEVSRAAEWERVIHALSLPGIGQQRARILAGLFPDFATLANATLEELAAPESAGGAGLGEAAETVFAHLAKPGTRELLFALEAAWTAEK